MRRRPLFLDVASGIGFGFRSLFFQTFQIANVPLSSGWAVLIEIDIDKL